MPHTDDDKDVLIASQELLDFGEPNAVAVGQEFFVYRRILPRDFQQQRLDLRGIPGFPGFNHVRENLRKAGRVFEHRFQEQFGILVRQVGKQINLKIDGFQAANLLLAALGPRIKMLVDPLIGIEAELLQFQRDDRHGGKPRFHGIERGRLANGVLEPGLQRGVGLLADMLAESLSGGTHADFEQFGLGFQGFHLSQIGLENDDRGTLVGLLHRFRERINVIFRKVNRAEQIDAVALSAHLPQRMQVLRWFRGLSRQPVAGHQGND